MRLSVIRLDGKGLFITGDSLVKLSKLSKNIAKVVVRLSVIRLDGKGLLVAGNGIVQLALLLKSIA